MDDDFWKAVREKEQASTGSSRTGVLNIALLFGTAGSMLAGGLLCGLIGVIVGTIDRGPLGAIEGGIFFSVLGGLLGAFLGMASGAIGWLPSVLFRDFPRMSYFAAVLLGTVVGAFVCDIYQVSSGSHNAYGAVYAALIIASSIAGGISSNFVLRRWMIDVSYDR